MQPWRGGGPAHKLLTGLVAVLALITVRCAIPTNPGLPTWDIPMAIPLSEQRYGLDSLVSKPGELDSSGNAIEIIEGGTLRFVYQDSIPSTKVTQEDLKFKPALEHHFTTPTDTLIIEPGEERESSLALRRILSGVPWNDGDQVDLANGTIPTNEREVTFDELDSLAVVHIVEPDGGGMNLSLFNNTNIVWDQITVTVALNEENHPVLDVLTWNNLQPQTGSTEFADLAGDSLKAGVLLIVDGTWSAQNSVELREAHGLEFSMAIDELHVDWAEAIIAKQAPQTSESRNYTDQDNWIESAQINRGKIHFTVENQTDVRDSIYIVFPNFFDAESGDTLRDAFEVARSADPNNPHIQTRDIDLAGFELRMPLPQSELEQQYFEARTTVVVLSSRDLDGNARFARISAEDSVITQFYTDSLFFDQFSGVAKNISVDVSEQVQELNIFDEQPDMQGDLAGNLELDHASFLFDLDNSFNFPMRLVLNFLSENDNTGESVTKEYEIDIAASQDTFSIDHVEELINVLPNRITFTTGVRMGREYFQTDPPYEARSISLGDSVQGLLSITSPFQLRINETTAVRPEPTLMAESFDESVINVKLITRVTNTVPMGGTVYLMAGSFFATNGESGLEIARRTLTRDNYDQYGIMTPLSIQTSPINPETGRVIEPMVDSTLTEIPQEGIDVFTQDSVYVRQVLVLDPTTGPQGQIQTIAANVEDHILVTILSEITYRVNEQDEEE